MTLQKLTLTNRRGQRLVAELALPKATPVGTCVNVHGWSSLKEAPHIQRFRNAFLANHYQVLSVDVAHSFNESEGDFFDSRLSLHCEDGEDTIQWAQQQEWYVRPLALTGHSMGGYTVARYAINHPDQVALLMPISPVVSGELLDAGYLKNDPEQFAAWEREGVREQESSSRPGVMKRHNWQTVLDWRQHDLLPEAHKITCPTFILTGTADPAVPPAHAKRLFDALSINDKTFETIAGAEHTFNTPNQLQTLQTLMQQWIADQLISI